MKKSKILMPLTGIAAIGAIAPVAVLTSCGNGGNTPVAGSIFDTTIMDNDGLFGANELEGQTQILLPVTLTLKSDPLEGHKWYHSYAAQGKGQSTGTKLYLEEQKEEIVTGREVGKKVFTGTLPILVNKGVTLKEDETTDFKVTYTEKDNDNKVVATQTVTYKVTAFATKVSYPTASVSSKGFAGSVTLKTIATKFPLTGIELNVAPVDGLTAELDEEVLSVDDQTSKYTLNIEKKADTTSKLKTINFNATIKAKSGDVPAGTYKFDIKEEITIKLIGGDKYVKPDCTQTLKTDKLITITVTEE